MRKSLLATVALLALPVIANATEWDGDAFRSQVIERMQSCGSVSPYDRAGLAFCDHVDRVRSSGVNILLMSEESLCYTFGDRNCTDAIDHDKRERRKAAGYRDPPGTTDLCPAPRKITRDGCQ